MNDKSKIPPNRVAETWNDATTQLVDVGMPEKHEPDEKVPCLVVVAGADVGRFYPLRKPSMIVGRGEEADVVVRDTSVSRQHARVDIDEAAHCRIEDLGSTNGTYVRGVRVMECDLEDGDRVQLGNVTVMKLEYHGRDENELRSQLFESGTRDSLTGVYNRRYFDGQLEAEVQLALRHGEALSLVVVDVDHFKKFNDEHGHLAGDAVLRHVARVMADRLRGTDLIARYGGDEFVLILRRTDTEGASILAHSMVERLRQDAPEFRGAVLPVTVTMGIATLSPASAYESGEALFDAADRALYCAKEAGRDRIAIAGQEECTKPGE